MPSRTRERASSASSSSPRRRLVVVLTVIGATGLASVSLAGADPSPADLSFVPLSTPHKVLSNVTIQPGKVDSPLVIGGGTTVPSDATAVQVLVSARATRSGTLAFFPTGNSAGRSGQMLNYPGGSVAADTTIEEPVGQSGELSFQNEGLGSVSVTATIEGYSTQVTAAGISGGGGSAGQVLTNTGSGTAWATQSPGYESQGSLHPVPNYEVKIDSVTLPAGSYLVTVNLSGSSYAAPGTIEFGIGAGIFAGTTTDAFLRALDGRYFGNASLTTLLTVARDNTEIDVLADGIAGNDLIVYDTIVAVRIGSAQGAGVVTQ